LAWLLPPGQLAWRRHDDVIRKSAEIKNDVLHNKIDPAENNQTKALYVKCVNGGLAVLVNCDITMPA
jgi:hypothetical protein